MRTRQTALGVRVAATAAALTLGIGACSSPSGDPPASGGGVFLGVRSTSAPTLLQEGRDCDQVLEDFQSFAPAAFRDSFGFDTGAGVTLDAAEAAPSRAPTAPAADGDDAFEETGVPLSGRADLPATGDAGAGDSSDTNTQEEGIDEPDAVENDGEHVYVVDEQELVILDGASAQVQSRTPLASWGAQLLLNGDRLLAITGGGYGVAMPGVPGDDVAVDVDGSVGVAEPAPPVESGGEPSSGDVLVDPDPGTSPTEPEPDPVPLPEPRPTEPPEFPVGTTIQLIDVTDRTAPRILQTTEVEGNHVDTRVVDGVARVVVSSYPQPPAVFERMDLPADGAGESVERSVGAQVENTTIDDWLPAFRTTTEPTDGGARSSVEGRVVDCDDVLVPDVNAGVAETSVLRVDFDDGFDPADTTTVVAEAGAVYASATTLYLAATQWVGIEEQRSIEPDDWSTAIHAFDLSADGPAAHVAAGEVPGSTLNQYSLSEYEGHLRIATTEGTPWGRSESESGVHVLRAQGDELVEVGAVGGLGRTETIQSVRFMGPVGYVVTFRQTDPLYVIDLSDPASPRSVGELKIPGFSSYLHPVGQGRLVGVGRDADLEGRDQGFLLSLFDVSDPTDPKQLQTWTERDAWSVAGSDPQAFLWWAPESSAVLPLERHGRAAQHAPDGYQSGMTVFEVDDGGISERAAVSVAGRYASRAIVVQGQLWSLFGGGVHVSDFDGENGSFTSYR